MEIKLMPLDKCLAKTHRTPAGNVPGRTVEEHCQISEAVASELLARMLAFWPAGSRYFPPEIVLFPAVHDVGKVSNLFQYKIYTALDSISDKTRRSLKHLNPWGYNDKAAYGGHVTVSRVSVIEATGNEYDGWTVAVHHGGHYEKLHKAGAEIFGNTGWENKRQELLARLRKGRQFPVLSEPCGYLLAAGLTIVSDWIASGELFSDPAVPWRQLVPTALDQAGFIWPQVIHGLSFKDIFGFEPNSAQKALADMVSGPGVYILEAPMGIGKTEAALFAAYQTLAKGQASGLYFGLPTQLTSNRMHARVEAFLQQILADPQKVILTHQNAWLVRFLNQTMGQEAAPGASWFESRRRGILAPFAVGTVDQALLGVMRVAYAPLRIFGLAGKVVILDEVHSYDAYTGYLLTQLAQNLAAIGCTVIILSATLTKKRHKALVHFTGMEDEVPDAYPLVSAYPGNKPGSFIKSDPPVSKNISIKIIHEDEKALNEILDRADQGQQCIWLENTVAMAQKIYKILSARAVGCDIETGLVHSRFILQDRTVNEKKWTDLLGKGDAAKNRHARGRILVGTQVLEQSLDIDADFMVSRFCPTDLVLQRLGRLWRHDRPDRHPGALPEAWLLAPPLADVLAEPEKALAESGTSHIYHPYTLGRALELWSCKNSVTLPDDIRGLLEASYAERETEPGAAMQKAKDALNKLAASCINKARYNLADTGQPLTDEDARTRLSDIENVPVLLLAGLDASRKTCRLLDGQTLRLDGDPKSMRETAANLYTALLHVSIHNAPAIEQAPCSPLLEPFLYEARKTDKNPSSLRVLIIGPDHRASDISGRRLDGITYNPGYGYKFEKQG